MTKLTALLTTCLLLLSQLLIAQDKKSVQQIGGVIFDSLTGQTVAYVQIYNESKRTGRIADSNGVFKFKASHGDTLVFMALGYLGKMLVINTNKPYNELVIRLSARIYEIEALTFEFPRTYKAFQEAILEVSPHEGEPMPELPVYNPYIRPKLLDTNYVHSGSFKFWHPVSGLYYKYSKTEQSLRKVRDLEEQALRQPAVDAKYNEELLTRITGFKGDTLRNFMLYCSFSFNFLYESSELEIIEAIHANYTEFMICCYERKEPDTPHK